MSDIEELLDKLAMWEGSPSAAAPIAKQARAEIERMQAEIERLREEIAWLRNPVNAEEAFNQQREIERLRARERELGTAERAYADGYAAAQHEIERLRMGEKALASQLDMTIANLFRNEVAVERLQTAIACWRDISERKDAEIERLQAALRDVVDGTDLMQMKAIARAAIEIPHHNPVMG